MKRFLIKWKVRLQVAYALFALIGMPYLVSVQLQEQLSGIGIHIPFIFIIFVGLLGLMLVGWLYEVTGLFSAENGFVFEQNIEWNKMKDNLQNKGEKL